MKTKELIRLLQEEDPSGEIECCVGNEDIFFVSCMDAYWDGRLQVLIRDPECRTYNVVGAKVTARGRKIKIVTHGIEDAIYENPDLPVDTSEIGNDRTRAEYDDSIQQWREESRRVKAEVDEWSKSRADREKIK